MKKERSFPHFPNLKTRKEKASGRRKDIRKDLFLRVWELCFHAFGRSRRQSFFVLLVQPILFLEFREEFLEDDDDGDKIKNGTKAEGEGLGLISDGSILRDDIEEGDIPEEDHVADHGIEDGKDGDIELLGIEKNIEDDKDIGQIELPFMHMGHEVRHRHRKDEEQLEDCLLLERRLVALEEESQSSIDDKG